MVDGSRALIAVGLVLVLVPFWGPIADVTGEDHVYKSVAVGAEEGEIETGETESGYAWEVTDRIACFRLTAFVTDSECVLEAGLRDGNATVTDPPRRLLWSSESTRPTYVVFGMEGQPYRRTFEYNESADIAVLGLRPADPETVLAEASSSLDRAHPAAGTAIESGEARTNEPIGVGDGRLYEHDDGYAIVYRAATPVFLSAKPTVERVLEFVAVGVGAIALYYARRGIGINPLRQG